MKSKTFYSCSPKFLYRKAEAKQNTVNQLIFVAIHFRVFVFSDIFTAINFHGLQNWTTQEQCTVYIDGHFCSDYFQEFVFLSENNLLAKVN